MDNVRVPRGPEIPARAGNTLLAALPRRDRRRFLAACERVELHAADLLNHPGTPLRYVYFPTGAYIALLLVPLDAGAGLEVSQVGNEGMVGTTVLLGVAASPMQYLVHGTGSALRMSCATLRRELARSPALRLRLDRYVHVTMHEMAQNVACTRFHLVEQRLSRWLLFAQDRSHSDTLFATHEFLAGMLGVRRVGITKAATALQKRAVIRYSRGHITILDRSGLEASACGCYFAATQLYDLVLGVPAPAT